MLKFFGRGSAFRENQNCAFFVEENRLILIDCAMSAFHAVRRSELKNFGEEIREIYVMVTHTHGDHIGGIPMLIHYAYFVFHVPVTVIVPSEELREDMKFVFDRLEGCNPAGYRLFTVEEITGKAGSGPEEGTGLQGGGPEDSGFAASWLECAIPTTHAPELAGRCFGYTLRVDGRKVIYTGDTNTLEPFLPYLTEGSVLYTEVSCHESPVHLPVSRLLEYEPFFSEKKIEVYLTHLDDEEIILEQVKGTEFNPAPLFTE